MHSPNDKDPTTRSMADELALRQGKRPAHDLAHYLREYAREKPEVVALWCFGLGFVLGWKLKPW